MQLLHPRDIPELDRRAEAEAGFSPRLLMERAGLAVAQAAAKHARGVGPALIFCGSGNNGGDGYAAALALGKMGYTPFCVDVFEKGQRTEEGQYFLEEYKKKYGRPTTLAHGDASVILGSLENSTVAVDAVFGTGFSGELPPVCRLLAKVLCESPVPVVAVDVPLGCDAETGEVMNGGYTAAATVCLSFYKRGLWSYPARERTGEMTLADLGIPRAMGAAFGEDTVLTDEAFAARLLGPRGKNTHKGSFGHALAFVGCRLYRGAAHLASEACLRMGAGLLTVASEEAVLSSLLRRLPEAILHPMPPFDGAASLTVDLGKAEEGKTAALAGSGLGRSPAVKEAVLAMLTREGCPLVLDADALNALSEVGASDVLCRAERQVILTPHPMEFARMMGLPVGEVQAHRLPLAELFARETGTVLVLKGAGTVITDGKRTYVNSTGSPALAKGGTGDVLAGAILGLLAGGLPPLEAAALGVYLHGRAGDVLEEKYSDRGVLPSGLGRQMAVEIRKIQKGK